MKANKGARMVYRILWKNQVYVPQSPRGSLRYDGLRVAYFKVHHPIYYYCAYFSIRAKAFDIKTMGAGLDAIKRRMEEIAENGRIMKPLMWRLTSIPLLRLSMKCGNVVLSLAS